MRRFLPVSRYLVKVLRNPERLNAEQRRDLMEIVEDRHQNAATLITSQLPLAKWHEVIGEPTFADALLDRIVHNAHKIELDGPSMRKIEADKTAPPPLTRSTWTSWPAS